MTEVTTLYTDQLKHIAKLTWIDQCPLDLEAREQVNLYRKKYFEECYPKLFSNEYCLRSFNCMDYEAMVFFSTLPESKQYIDTIASKAAFNGDQILLDQMLALGANEYNVIAITAASGEHLDIVNRMIELGANDYHGIAAAAVSVYKGHLDIINRMIELGITNYNYIAMVAAKQGHLSIVNIMIELGANDYNKIAICAAKGGHSLIVDRMTELGFVDYQ